MNVHPSMSDELVIENIKILKDAGADLTRVAISHVDGFNHFRVEGRVLNGHSYTENRRYHPDDRGGIYQPDPDSPRLLRQKLPGRLWRIWICAHFE